MPLCHYLAMAVLAILATMSVTESQKECTKLFNYNAEITPFSENYTYRRTEFPKQLLQHNADVYCLQGYWRERDMEVLLSEVNSTLPYHFSAIHSSVGVLQEDDVVSPSPCTIPEIEFYQSVVMTCARARGCVSAYSPLSKANAIKCLVRGCASELRHAYITADCISCIISYSTHSLDNGLSRCTPTTDSRNKRLNSPGLVLLSKKRITTAKYVSYFPGRDLLVQTGYVEAEVEDLGKVLCTSTTIPHPDLYYEYDSGYDNSNDQKSAEIDHLVDNFCGKNHSLLGGIYSSPEIPMMNITAFSPQYYNRLVNAGYSDPYREQSGACTICGKKPGVPGLHLDHLFIKGKAYTARTVERVLDITWNSEYSDHYGVQVTVCPA